MGVRVRRSFKVVPGVRVTVTPRGVSASVGGKYARVSTHSSGRVTRTTRIPGTSISHVAVSRSRSRQRPSAQAGAAATPPVRRPAPPGLFAPSWEKELFRALAAEEVGSLVRIGGTYPEARHVCMTLDAFSYEGPGRDTRARAILEEVWASGFDPQRDRFLSTYVASATTTIGIAPGISAQLPLSRVAIGLTLAELRQQFGDLAGATYLVESLEPSTIAAVSLAELYAQQGRWRDMVDLTNALDGNDDCTIFLLAQRGIALREQGYFQASREAFRASLARRSQPAELRHRTLIERSLTYRAEGKNSMARKDLERVLADDAEYPGLAEALAALEG